MKSWESNRLHKLLIPTLFNKTITMIILISMNHLCLLVL